MENNFNSILELATRFDTDLKCRQYLAEKLWDGKPVCPHCGNENICSFSDNKRYKCKDCKKQFTVTVGTIFEGSHIPLQKWFIAVYLLSAHKKGISSLQLSRDLHITQKSAWYMLHRLRYAIRTKSFLAPLTKVVEIDESFIGGKEGNKHKSKRGIAEKTVVFGMIERGGEVRTQKINGAKVSEVLPIITQNVDRDAVVMTDESQIYVKLKKMYLHSTVNHGGGEYKRGITHTNTIENFWSIFSRGIIGIYHQITPKHMDKYLDEFEFRHNSRKVTQQTRFDAMIQQSGGYMSYKELIQK